MAPPTVEELLERLRTRGMPVGGAEALAFTLPGSGEGAPRITATPCTTADADTPVSPALKARIDARLLRSKQEFCLYLERATEADLSVFSAADEVFPANYPAIILYMYPLTEGKGPDYTYTSPAGLSVRDVVRCIVAYGYNNLPRHLRRRGGGGGRGGARGACEAARAEPRPHGGAVWHLGARPGRPRAGGLHLGAQPRRRRRRAAAAHRLLNGCEADVKETRKQQQRRSATRQSLAQTASEAT